MPTNAREAADGDVRIGARGWHGGWCWKKLTPLLHAAGHEVYAPTMTRLGDHVHHVSPDLTLDTNIEDIPTVLIYGT